MYFYNSHESSFSMAMGVNGIRYGWDEDILYLYPTTISLIHIIHLLAKYQLSVLRLYLLRLIDNK